MNKEGKKRLFREDCWKDLISRDVIYSGKDDCINDSEPINIMFEWYKRLILSNSWQLQVNHFFFEQIFHVLLQQNSSISHHTFLVCTSSLKSKAIFNFPNRQLPNLF